MSKLILWLIRAYQKVISPWTPKTCRFHPTCSEYSYQAVKKYGALKGGFKSIKRISKCHPFNPGGYDPLK
jgi:putative membrane protein insertion efficiency factor